MSDSDEIKEALLEQIADVHETFVELMNERLPEVGKHELELYFTVLGKLVSKLEQKDKDLRSAAQELFAEVASVVMTGLTR
ncbi:MAG TPA: hypothetical protein VGK20_06710 [Candidatus Binatia bacterium]|jgi:hypothetical protein